MLLTWIGRPLYPPSPLRSAYVFLFALGSVRFKDHELDGTGRLGTVAGSHLAPPNSPCGPLLPRHQVSPDAVVVDRMPPA